MAASGGKRIDLGADQNLIIGEDRTFEIRVLDSAGAVQVMTGWALQFVIAKVASQTALISLTVGSGITIENGAGTDDQATCVLTDDNTNTLTDEGEYDYALKRTDAGSEAYLQYGRMLWLKGAIA